MSAPDPPYVYQEFPKWVYHKHSTPVRRIDRIVASADEQAALGPDWTELAVLRLGMAPAVPGEGPTSQADRTIVPAEQLDFLRSHLAEIRAVLSQSPFSAFYDQHGSELIGGPSDPDECRQRKQRIEELLEQMVLAVGLVPRGSHALAGGLEVFRQFAIDHHYQCVQTLSELPGCPIRVDRFCEVLAAWCRHLITRATASMAAALASHPAIQRFPEASSQLRAKRQAQDQALRKAERERVVQPILDDLGWTASKWATEAGVGPAVAINYLSGKTKKLQPKKGELLAAAIGKPLSFLPK